MALLTHHGLFAPAMMILGNASVSVVWLRVAENCFLDCGATILDPTGYIG